MSPPAFLADTNVISELARRNPNPGVVAWAKTVSMITVSVISVEEIFYGLARKPNRRIGIWFEDFFDAHCDISGVTSEVARRAGELRGSLAARGTPRTQADMLIAATVQVNQQTLVTRNMRAFADCGISLLDPFA